MKKFILIVAGIFLAGVSLNTVAATAGIGNAEIISIVIDSENFGGCMVNTDKVLANHGLNCTSTWVTFSCDGTFNSQAFAFRKLDQAQMAMALNKKIFMVVDDSKKHNSYCFARRIDINK